MGSWVVPHEFNAVPASQAGESQEFCDFLRGIESHRFASLLDLSRPNHVTLSSILGRIGGRWQLALGIFKALQATPWWHFHAALGPCAKRVSRVPHRLGVLAQAFVSIG